MAISNSGTWTPCVPVGNAGWRNGAKDAGRKPPRPNAMPPETPALAHRQRVHRGTFAFGCGMIAFGRPGRSAQPAPGLPRPVAARNGPGAPAPGGDGQRPLAPYRNAGLLPGTGLAPCRIQYPAAP